MSRSKLVKSKRLWALIISLFSVAAFFVFDSQRNFAAAEQSPLTAKMKSAATFSAAPESLKPVPSAFKSNNCRSAVPTSMDVVFNVSGMKGAVKTIALNNLTFDPQFKWNADLKAALISPDGTVSKTLFGGSVSKNCLELKALPETYDYSDEVLSSAFSTVSDANGVWILRLTDQSGGQLGTVQSVSLAISTSDAANVPVLPTNADFNADGKTDYVTIRPSSAGFSENSFAPQRPNFYATRGQRKFQRRPSADNLTLDGDPLTWWVRTNGTLAYTKTVNGDFTTDTPIPADFDGDGKNDVAVWRASSDSAFYILQSATNTLRVEHFGLATDDPAVVADYDGDKKADPATFRCPDSTPGQCYFYYRGSLNNPNNQITYVPWGYGVTGDLLPYPGDFDGDGKADFCLQRADPQNSLLGQFVLLKSADFKFEIINWGFLSDTIVPGDFDGDKKTDFCVARLESLPYDPGDKVSYYILLRTGGGTNNSPIRFGYGDDIPVPGDYDGDGKTDIAIWRPYPDASDPTPQEPKFIILKSSDKGVIFYPWGLPNDYPVANWQVK